MIISHRHKFIFVKSPKTAGSALQHALSKVCGVDDVVTDMTFAPRDYIPRNCRKWRTHTSATEIRRREPKAFAEYFTFCFERNPWDRLVSEYWWVRRRGSVSSKFSLWLPKRLDERNHWREMCTERGKVIVDFIGRYEDLDKDYLYICNMLGIESHPLERLKSDCRTNERHYSAYYDDKTRDMVATCFADTIAYCGYSFEGDDESNCSINRST